MSIRISGGQFGVLFMNCIYHWGILCAWCAYIQFWFDVILSGFGIINKQTGLLIDFYWHLLSFANPKFYWRYLRLILGASHNIASVSGLIIRLISIMLQYLNWLISLNRDFVVGREIKQKMCIHLGRVSGRSKLLQRKIHVFYVRYTAEVESQL